MKMQQERIRVRAEKKKVRVSADVKDSDKHLSGNGRK